ncbi:MAG: xanthine dehydrogenase [Myxococcaceae bacterium]|nr:MAG: xanthine dehydrogenase [Myxococcaceae bacterium]
MSNPVRFYLNGRPVTVEQPSPDLLLIDHLRSPGVGLAGPKKPCGQGGCGGCAVLLSRWDEAAARPEHVAINACLRPVLALDGLSVTTVEGMLCAAKSRDGTNPVAWRLASNNGSQCGYCTVGFVVNMSEFLANNPAATRREIEEAVDGNLCRCTGYRPILTGLKTFASDWSAQDEAERMACLVDADADALRPDGELVIPFPDGARAPARGFSGALGDRRWLSPGSVDELVTEMRAHRDAATRLVAANTSYGIYKDEYQAASVFLDVRAVSELHAPPVVGGGGVRVSAGTTYSDAIALLGRVMVARDELEPGPDGAPVPRADTALGALRFMARRTAGRIVRNAATLGGNVMLVLRHLHAGTGEAFPSDLATAMVAAGARVEYVDARGAGAATVRTTDLAALVDAALADPELPGALVLVAFHLPFGAPTDVLLPQRVALRDVNAHAIVNATTRLALSAHCVVEDAALVFGGIAPHPWRATATERAMRGRTLSLEGVAALARTLAHEVLAELERGARRAADAPATGFTDEYRVQLATSFLYKSVVHALDARGAAVPGPVRSGGAITWGRWPVSGGRQSYKVQDFKRPLSQPHVKTSAVEQALGRVRYTHELPAPPRTAHGSLVQSRRALASWRFCVPGRDGAVDVATLRAHLAEAFDAFAGLVTAADVASPARNLHGIGLDQPLFAVDRVDYVGQTIALVAATDAQAAERIAAYVASRCVAYGPVSTAPGDPAWAGAPVLGIDRAIAVGSIYPDYPTQAPFNAHIWKVMRPGSRFGWADVAREPLDRRITSAQGAVDGVPCQIVGSTQSTGGQVHFYLEPQAAIAEPLEGGGMRVRPSAQSPMGIHGTVARALGVRHNRVEVQVPPLGGGFGGKTEAAKFVAGAAAVAAAALRRPVRLALTREQDTALVGGRHAFYGQTQVAIDRGVLDPDQRGVIHGFLGRMWTDGGAFLDCSFIVADCAQTRIDNAYRVRHFESQIDVCRTNTAPSTAARAFGDLQGRLIAENALDDAAFAIGMTAEDVREKNLYERGDVTPFGQALSHCYLRDVWAYLQRVADHPAKAREVAEFNAQHRWRKRGLAMVPVKYGSGRNVAAFAQAAAVVAVYRGDGTVVIHQGGVEMGQGLHTLVRQVAAYVLNVPLDMIRVEAPNTAVIPNPTGTGASTGTAYNGEAVRRVCQEMRARLTAFADELRLEHGNDWCVKKGVDYWNRGEQGWSAPVAPGGAELVWQRLVALAYLHRVGLVCSFTAPVPGGETPAPALTYKPSELQPVIPGYASAPGGTPAEFDSFVGFTYSAACSVVEVDVLTGEVKILSADIVYDAGWSLNPALDIGQVEGAFVQGIGYVLTERLVFESRGEAIGRLNTLNTWSYKPPAAASIPLRMNTHLFPRDATRVPIAPTDGLLSSKEVGEPPTVLAASVFFAVKAAVRASRLERGLDGLFRLDAPATVQEVRRACSVGVEDFEC